jgi:hypothetical protein
MPTAKSASQITVKLESQIAERCEKLAERVEKLSENVDRRLGFLDESIAIREKEKLYDSLGDAIDGLRKVYRKFVAIVEHLEESNVKPQWLRNIDDSLEDDL